MIAEMRTIDVLDGTAAGPAVVAEKTVPLLEVMFRLHIKFFKLPASKYDSLFPAQALPGPREGQGRTSQTTCTNSW